MRGFGTTVAWVTILFEETARPLLPLDWCPVIQGSGDAIHGLAPGEHEDFLRAFIGQLLSWGCGNVLLVNQPLWLADVDIEARLESYRQVQKHVCEEVTGVVCGPDLSEHITPAMYVDDQVHLNDIGNLMAASLMEKAIKTHPKGPPH